jgi:uncharacterized protein (DUF2147 family)
LPARLGQYFNLEDDDMFDITSAGRSAACALALVLSVGAARAQDQDILGLWSTDQGKGRVEITKCAAPKQGLCGKIVWLKEPNDKDGKPQTDRGNKNASLRNRPILGLALFEGWRQAGRQKWEGSVYDPEDGQSYDVDITLAGDKLTLKGCIAFICDSDTWTRYRGQ